MRIWSFVRGRPIIPFTLILLLKGALVWFVIFDGGPSWMTMLTEIPFILLVFIAIEWFASKRKYLYYMLVNLLITILYFAVLMYYKYYGIIVTYHALEQADKVAQVGESTYSLLDPYYLLIFIDIVVFGLFMIRPKTIAKLKHLGMRRKANRSALFGTFLVSAALCVFNIWPNHASMNLPSPAVYDKTGGQVDILPTVANLFGVSLKDQIHFGEDLLNQDANLLPMRHFLPTGSFINDRSVFLPGIAYEDGTNFDVRDNGVLEGGSTEDEYNRALKLLNLSDSYATQLPALQESSGPANGAKKE
ncbi:hypothetical protein [Cohnella sp. REN36]|uniref:hypothetical protein n=1 Tax=Cohnella sp. REN36 TaxID=2887347 RepID=UPI001D133C41|nr:hypothetical protein [Cohnella sp. REN36]MCC3376844.1 hypothetical protein [Cohnella sp. REN36]